MLENAKWIWKPGPVVPDSYGEFRRSFCCKGGGRVLLYIAFDTSAEVYVNGELVLFGQCADFPYFKLYRTVDISDCCREGDNELYIHIWYYGKGNATYYPSEPGLLYRIDCDGTALAVSDSDTLARTDMRYLQGRCKNITGQMGFSYCCNLGAQQTEYEAAVITDKQTSLHPLPICNLELGAPVKTRAVRADLYDIGREEAGFLSLEIDSPCEQLLTVTYGEHIADGGVRRIIGNTRDFSVELRLHKGKNKYMNCFRRMAGRYIELHHEQPIEVHSLAISPVIYPAEVLPYRASDGEMQKIYDTAVRTLQLCMHEHYEDCPWREQALYALDSRNQMLCGYYCFDGYAFARHSIVLMSKGIKSNGLLELTYPALDTPAIPFFSLVYPMLVHEYITHSGDAGILSEVQPAIDSIMARFDGSIEENGLIANLPYPFWNFYEWSPGSDNEHELGRLPDAPYAPRYDLMLNCAYILASEYRDKLSGTHTELSHMRQAIHRSFYDSERGLYRGTVGHDIYTELGNSMALLARVAPEAAAAEIAVKLSGANDMVPVTLSMMCFKYDALLSVSEGYGSYVLDDIRRSYMHMLNRGATSFWETIEGQSAFDGAGSLCHGWSAMPVYYIKKLGESKQ